METVTVITEKRKKRRNESSPWRQAFKKIKKNKMALVGFYVLIFMFLFCFIGPFFSPYASGKYKLRSLTNHLVFLIGLVQIN